MPTLLPLRDYSEKDVIGFYCYSGTLPVSKGSLLKLQGSGFVASQDPTETLGSPGASYTNTVSQRYGVPFKLSLAGTGDHAIGISLYDVKETDENGLPLRFNPRKAYELEAVISGQTLPVAVKGRFLYSGITGTVVPGQRLYQGVNGLIEANINSAQGAGGLPPAVGVGYALGTKDAQGLCFVQLNLT